MRKSRYFLALLAGVGVAGAALASAASLGGVASTGLGADDTVVASCDTDGVTITYATAWDATDARYEVTSATVGGIDAACDGQTLSLTLSDGSAAVGSGTAVVDDTSEAVTFASAPSAEAVVAASVLITG